MESITSIEPKATLEGWRTNEDIVKDVIKGLKNATVEISKAGNELYHIFGMEQPTGAVYDTLPLLEGAISHLERITTSEFETNAE